MEPNSTESVNPQNSCADIQQQYEELFREAANAVIAAGFGSPKNHDELIASLQMMAIQEM